MATEPKPKAAKKEEALAGAAGRIPRLPPAANFFSDPLEAKKGFF